MLINLNRHFSLSEETAQPNVYHHLTIFWECWSLFESRRDFLKIGLHENPPGTTLNAGLFNVTEEPIVVLQYIAMIDYKIDEMRSGWHCSLARWQTIEIYIWCGSASTHKKTHYLLVLLVSKNSFSIKKVTFNKIMVLPLSSVVR